MKSTLVALVIILITHPAFALVAGDYIGEVHVKFPASEVRKIEATVSQYIDTNDIEQQFITFSDVCRPKVCSAIYKTIQGKNANLYRDYGKIIFPSSGGGYKFLDLTSYNEDINKRPGFVITTKDNQKFHFMMKMD